MSESERINLTPEQLAALNVLLGGFLEDNGNQATEVEISYGTRPDGRTEITLRGNFPSSRRWYMMAEITPGGGIKLRKARPDKG